MGSGRESNGRKSRETAETCCSRSNIRAPPRCALLPRLIVSDDENDRGDSAAAAALNCWVAAECSEAEEAEFGRGTGNADARGA